MGDDGDDDGGDGDDNDDDDGGQGGSFIERDSVTKGTYMYCDQLYVL